MGVLLSDEEKQSLRRDLVGPVKSFLREVGDDTVGDAKKFYTARARETEKSVRRAQAQTREKLAAIRREQEELKKHRQAMMKRAAIILALLALFSFLAISAALNAHADAEPYTQGAVYREPSFRCVSAGKDPPLPAPTRYGCTKRDCLKPPLAALISCREIRAQRLSRSLYCVVYINLSQYLASSSSFPRKSCCLDSISAFRRFCPPCKSSMRRWLSSKSSSRSF